MEIVMETLRSSETSVLTRATLRNITDDGTLHSHQCENLKSYTEFSTDHQSFRVYMFVK
jgi:hypothetical protein